MPETLADYTGDGITTDLIQVAVSLPDAGTTYTVAGYVKKVGNAGVNVASTTLTSAGVPGSGTNYEIVQVDYTSGIATIKTSTSSLPTPDANNIVVFSQTIPTGASADPVLDGATVTPDN